MTAAYTVNCSILLTELPLLDRPRAARNAGFEAVEFWWPFESPTPPDAEVTAFIRAIQDAGVQLTGLNFAAGDMPAGDRGILSDPAMTQAFRDNVDIAVGIAETLGTRAFNALYGNRIDDCPHRRLRTMSGPRTSPTPQDAADRIGATVLIEPVSGAPRYPLMTAADAIRVIDRVHNEHGATNLRLLADLYHLHVNGDDINAVIRDYGSRIGHVQIADAPGRGEPGTGEIPLRHLPRAAGRTGLRGYVGLEYKATRPDTFEWLPPRARRAASAHDHHATSRNEDLMSTIAFIGLGIMGGPMASHLVKAGHTVIGLDTRRNASPPLVEAGGKSAESIEQAVKDADVVAIMVPDSPQVQSVLLGDDGVFAHAQPGTLVIDFSAIRPDVTAEFAQIGAERGLRILDAPVSGGEPGAKNATLSIMVGGSEEDFAAAKPIFDIVGKTIVHVGPNGVRPDRQGGQPADRRGQHRAARRGDHLPAGLRRRHRRRGQGARRRAGRFGRARPEGAEDAGSATSTPASASRFTTRTWASSPPPRARPAW